MSPAESFLIAAARRGDRDAFELLVRGSELQVYRVALRMLGSPADAEDAAQEAYVRAWRSLGGFRGNSSFTTWMYRLVTNCCLDALRARRVVAPIEVAEIDDTAYAGPETVLEQRERTRGLMAAIGRLAPDQRAALVLREIEGLSYAEIAEVLRISVTAVKGRIHRARLSLAVGSEAWR